MDIKGTTRVCGLIGNPVGHSVSPAIHNNLAQLTGKDMVYTTFKVEKGDVNLAVSWANDQMLFRNKNLGEICRFLSKWYNVKINLSPELKDQFRYTFTLRHEPLEEILRIMSRIHPIAYSFDEENVVTIGKK